MYKNEIKEQVIAMRRAGLSYTLIAEQTGLAKSTLSLWLSDVAYEPNEQVVERIGKARARAGLVKHQQKLQTLDMAKRQAARDIKGLSKRDLLMLGIALYIGEGEKNDNVGIVNADPRIIRLAMRWLETVYGLTRANVTLAIHLYPDNNSEACLQYWSEQTGIPLQQFGKTQIDRRKKQANKRGKLPYGTAHLRVKSNGNKTFGVLLSRRIKALMDRVLEDV